MRVTCESTCKDIEDRMHQENKTTDLQTVIDNISYLEKSSLYLQFVKFVEDLRLVEEMKLSNDVNTKTIQLINFSLFTAQSWKYLYYLGMMKRVFHLM